jgi:hypothetical protein
MAQQPLLTRLLCLPSGRAQPVQPEMLPGGSQLLGVFPLTCVWLSVTVAGPPKSPLMIPPAPPDAELPVTWLLLSVSATTGVLGRPKLKFAMPPPMPSSVPSLGAVFR